VVAAVVAAAGMSATSVPTTAGVPTTAVIAATGMAAAGVTATAHMACAHMIAAAMIAATGHGDMPHGPTMLVMAAMSASRPAVPANRAAPSKASPVGVAAPVVSRPMPADRVPAIVAAAEQELNVLHRRRRADGLYAEDQSAIRRRLGVRQRGER
jgi:hypothetical protein